MSISRLRKSRGYSIAAALTMIGILILVAVAVQSTIPVTTSPASMGAQAAAPTTNLSSDPTVGAGVISASSLSATVQGDARCNKKLNDAKQAKNGSNAETLCVPGCTYKVYANPNKVVGTDQCKSWPEGDAKTRCETQSSGGCDVMQCAMERWRSGLTRLS